jgi:uncharacterized protein (DUF433 family)
LPFGSRKAAVQHHPSQAEAAHAFPHIDDTGRRPVVRGTDIKVSQIANEFEHLGMTPDEIVEAHPHISLAEVHAALAYFYDHQALIRNEWQEARAFIAEMRLRYPSRLSR